MKVYKVTNAERNDVAEIERWVLTDSPEEFSISRKKILQWANFLVRVPETEQEIINWYNETVIGDCLAKGTTIQEAQESFEVENFLPLADEEYFEMEDYWFIPNGRGELVEEEWIGGDEELLEQLRNNTPCESRALPEHILKNNGYECDFSKWVIYGGAEVEDRTEERSEVINELWRRADVIISEWKKKPFHHKLLDSRPYLDSILAPIGYPFSPIKYSLVKRYPWLVNEFRGRVMTSEEYASNVYDEEMDNIREHVWGCY